MAFETLNGGHFGEDAIFLSCDALSSLDLGLIVPKVHSPPPTPPPPLLWRSSPRPGACRLGKAGGWGGVPAVVHSENLWALKANFLLKFLYSLKLFY